MLVECPICSLVCESFEPFGESSRSHRPNAMCPGCGSLERHRLVWVYLLNETNLFSGATKRMLHVAPEAALAPRLSTAPTIDYLSADLDPTRAMVGMDLTDIQLPDDSFDVIYCSHVLEHIPDDRRAMRELFRVLAPDGWAILQSPVWREVTEEDPSMTNPAERAARFGQSDHLRSYGRDYAERLAEPGFQVTVDPYPRRLGPEWIKRFVLMRPEDVHLCRKLSAGPAGGVVDRLTSSVPAPGPRRQP
jgi:SAM-dependent methyltransferase